MLLLYGNWLELDFVLLLLMFAIDINAAVSCGFAISVEFVLMCVC
jgi:hypothetical protein